MDNVLDYFRFFKYAPTLNQYFLFQREKMDKEELLAKVKKNEGLIILNSRIALKSDIDLFEQSEKRSKISQQKLKSRKSFLHLLGYIPLVQFMGISGSVAAGNAKEEDDVDVFVISKAGWLWTARFFVLAVASLFGMRRYPKDTKYKDKLCFNLFFDESNLTIPKDKQTEYVGHEVLQLVPVMNKNRIYERFLFTNNWVIKLFPNALELSSSGLTRGSREIKLDSRLRGNDKDSFIETIFRTFQLFLMRRNRTTERITNTQLWFFPDDFEKRMVK